jgi:acetolactate synthase-1/2/3 large subunit|tara:strand:+ start:5442 stop:7247 length:1806 start_codon:yes stop_codon:yes gene_type:complete
MSNIDAESEVQGTALVEPEMGDLLVAYLNQLGVEYVFGVPGGAIEPLYNALARSERQGGVRAVVARHETGAAFMADGYARNTGKLGVCCSTTGPGATNMITGVASAYENNVPMLVITAQTAISTFGKGAIQDSSCTGINTVGLYQHCTRYNTLISHPAQFEHKLAAAIMSAMGSPAGPAHISVPRDVMALHAPVSQPTYALNKLLDRPTLIDETAVDALYDEITHAKKPIFIIGDEACNAMSGILSLATAASAEIIVTPHGKGMVSPYHPLFKGVIGFAGHESAKQLLADPNVDLVVAIGARFGEFSSNAWDTKTLLTNRLVHVESTDANLTRTPMAKLHVRGCLESIFSRLADRYKADPRLNMKLVPPDTEEQDEEFEAPLEMHFECDDMEAFNSPNKPITPQRLMRDLPSLFPPNTKYLADSGNSFAWATHYLHPYDRRFAGMRERGGLFSASMDFASMGWAIGSAIGTALAAPNIPVVCLTGDGSWLMSGQELTVAVEESLTVIFIVLNDSAYGMVKHGQMLTGAERTANQLTKVDFCALAKAMGADAVVIDSPSQLNGLDIKAICRRNGPTVLDVRIDKEQAPPIRLRTNVLKSVKG